MHEDIKKIKGTHLRYLTVFTLHNGPPRLLSLWRNGYLPLAWRISPWFPLLMSEMVAKWWTNDMLTTGSTPMCFLLSCYVGSPSEIKCMSWIGLCAFYIFVQSSSEFRGHIIQWKRPSHKGELMREDLLKISGRHWDWEHEFMSTFWISKLV